GHRDRINALAFSRDGNLLISASDDTTILIWDLYGFRKEGSDRPPALDAKELTDLWGTLSVEEGVESFKAIATLLQAPEATTRFLKQRLKVVPRLDAGLLEKMVRDLDSDDFDTRERATHALEAHAQSAVAVLKKELAKDP